MKSEHICKVQALLALALDPSSSCPLLEVRPCGGKRRGRCALPAYHGACSRRGVSVGECSGRGRYDRLREILRDILQASQQERGTERESVRSCVRACFDAVAVAVFPTQTQIRRREDIIRPLDWQAKARQGPFHPTNCGRGHKICRETRAHAT